MKPTRMHFLPAIITAVLLLGSLGVPGTARTQTQELPQTIHYGIELGDVLCGYAEITLTAAERDGVPVIQLDENVLMMLTALGSEFNTRQTLQYQIDRESGNFVWHTNEVEQGDTHLGAAYVVRDGAVYLTPLGEEEETRIDLPEGTVLPNPMIYDYLLRDFADPVTTSRVHKTLQVRDGKVLDITTTRLPDEDLELAGRLWHTMVFDQLDEEAALNIRVWIDRESGQLVQANVLNRRIFRTDASVIKKIKVADMNSTIMVPTNENITDIQGIRYMKVRARLTPVGLPLDEEGLTVPGQTFTGTVTDNAVDGIFEIRHVPYTGDNAPSFPHDYSNQTELVKYLEADRYCESDDAVLAGKAREITAGAADSWNAVQRMSAWVAENIDYAIPGGGTARKTFDTRAGECGAHSLLLAAFCRSVGIPARVVWGCMYVPNQGGAFGQHGWNEIYMGDAGWIPVDATAQETDFVDSGHLRVGELEGTTIALNATEFEILEYEIGSGEDRPDAARLLPYLGIYSSKDVGDREFTVLDQGGKLGLDIPGQMVLLFNDPDDAGDWVCQLAPKLRIRFESDGSGAITALSLMEKNRMPRKAAPAENAEDAPEEFIAFLGSYVLQGANVVFAVIYSNGTLCLREPRGAEYPLTFDENAGYWRDASGTRRIVFETDGTGAVVAFTGTHITRLERR